MSATQTIAFLLYRLLEPTSRAQSVFRHNNTASRGQRKCILCGECCPGYSTRYARTKRSLAWEAAHDCSASWLAARSLSGDRLDTAERLAAEPGAFDEDSVLLDYLRQGMVI